eukprot:scaffold255119_cov79-Cyclotella_meneghiniana.AAC.1
MTESLLRGCPPRETKSLLACTEGEGGLFWGAHYSTPSTAVNNQNNHKPQEISIHRLPCPHRSILVTLNTNTQHEPLTPNKATGHQLLNSPQSATWTRRKCSARSTFHTSTAHHHDHNMNPLHRLSRPLTHRVTSTHQLSSPLRSITSTPHRCAPPKTKPKSSDEPKVKQQKGGNKTKAPSASQSAAKEAASTKMERIMVEAIDAPYIGPPPAPEEEMAERYRIGRNYVIGCFERHNEINHDLAVKIRMKRYALRMLPKEGQIGDSSLELDGKTTSVYGRWREEAMKIEHWSTIGPP